MKLITTHPLGAIALGVSLALSGAAFAQGAAQGSTAQGQAQVGVQQTGAGSQAQAGQSQAAQGLQNPQAIGAQARGASASQNAATPSVDQAGTTTSSTGMRADDSAAVAAGNRATARVGSRDYGDAGIGAGVDTTLSTDVDGRPDQPAQVGMSTGTLGEFSTFDANGDGFVERSELQGSNSLVNDDYNRFDLDDNGRLDRYEFESLGAGAFTSLDANRDNWLDQQETSAFAGLESNFASADSDGDGRISRAEHNAFVDAGTWSSDRDRYAFAYLDVDGDGFLSRTEAQAFAGASAEFDTLDNDADGLVDQQAYDSFLNDWDEDDYAIGEQ